MDRSFRTAVQGLAAAVAVTATLGLGFAVGNASADPGDPVAEMGQMHEQMHRTGVPMSMGGHTAVEMDEMHARMSAGLSPQDRALHDRMDEACSGPQLREERLMRCLNWKVIAGLTAAGIGIYVFAPTWAVGALPLLIVAACPLSMLLMMRAMGSMGSCKTTDGTDEADEVARLRAEVAELRAERQSR